MSFTGFTFLIRFLPAALLLVYLVPDWAKNAVLVFLSLFFFAWGDLQGLPVLVGILLLTFFGARLVAGTEKKSTKKALFVLFLLLQLSPLLVYKYTGFLLGNLKGLIPALSVPKWVAPAGISFFTFTAMGYLIDVYTGAQTVCDSFVDTALFITFFPKLLMGPIVRMQDIQEELNRRTITAEDLESGSTLFIVGLSKKVLLANAIAKLWEEVSLLGYGALSTPLAWLGVLAYSFQLYFDFSGYSDMAIGLGRLMGFHFPKNFDTPYSSTSVTEFWRRWHISMGNWFKNYIYFPLGGSRCSRGRQIFNTFVVWACTGLWHGANWNFLLWGLYYFVLLIIEKFFLAKPLQKAPVAGHLWVYLTTLVGWSLFAVSDFTALGQLFRALFTGQSGYPAAYYLRNYGVLLVLCALLCTETIEDLIQKIFKNRWIKAAVCLVLLLLCFAYLTDATFQPFLYAQF